MSTKAALITGGATGIGWACTEALLHDGYAVTICQHQQSALDAIAPKLAAYVDRTHTILADLASDEGCHRAVAACIEQYGRIDVLVNNAAVTGPPAVGSLHQMSDDWMSRIVDVNLKAAYRSARHASAEMRRLGIRGVIVNIGSIASFAAAPKAVAYAMTKAGLLGLTRALALDLAADGIRCVMVAPGAIDTPANASKEYLQERSHERYTRDIPLESLGDPRDVAAAVAFLCSDSARYVTGTALVVDGGMLAY